ncbi:aldehyde dehydrogenase family protein [Paenibacillus elgii]|uniref:aldehyde dehydrogenase family protein n=1 Tax=Paenibacillus elgii TaxID=189691 RepID=UPI0037CBC0CF
MRQRVRIAIAAGNTVVLKPAGQTLLSAFSSWSCLWKPGFRSELRTSSPATAESSAIIRRVPPCLDVITFTGSPYVGESIRVKAGLKRVTLELGSNSAVIVDSDARIQFHYCELCHGHLLVPRASLLLLTACVLAGRQV